ncbi:hypothetical protein [Flavobacterium sp. HSC-61S13]|uniref:hypothetical protein n=1 Tax=Flavobacterium sp. HSC-61S13 TaxID=2910963 RepID=UPI0020A21689|nr:hypothetical protein [Flavobacterium sp. HSC-61S13]MCP1995146.1 hypothetical protein [Flavobacterium sp. HSC-61S13]
MSVSLSMLLTACSVNSDSENIAQNKEQYLTQNSVSELANASLDLEQIYSSVGGSNASISEVIDLAQNLAMSPEFINNHALDTNGYVPVAAVAVQGILSLDESAIQQSSHSNAFKNHALNIINGQQNIQSFREIVMGDDRLLISDKKVLLDAIDFSLISSEHGVDDEWRKRKFMGYVVAQQVSSLNVVITATVLNIAMKQ